MASKGTKQYAVQLYFVQKSKNQIKYWQLSNMGVGALDSHIKSKAHKKAEGIANIQPSIAVKFQNSKSASNDKSKCANEI